MFRGCQQVGAAAVLDQGRACSSQLEKAGFEDVSVLACLSGDNLGVRVLQVEASFGPCDRLAFVWQEG